MKDYFRKNKSVRFSFPIDGDCINSGDGVRKDDDLIVKVKVCAPAGAEIFVNDGYKYGTGRNLQGGLRQHQRGTF